jgi:3-keto-disaccharide hydrolase
MPARALLSAVAAVAIAISPTLAQEQEQKNPGYTDTPMLPGMPWHVHDPARPHPPVVTPAPAPDKPVPPPSDAIVLFDGKDLDAWTGHGGKASWKIEDGYAEVNHTGDIQTKQQFGSFQLHIEWATPAEVKGTSQERGNSGVFLHGRFEVQVLDSYENVTYADGQAAAIYGQYPPLVNACRKPGEWQTYNILFEAPRFGSDGKLETPAYVTVIQNGVVVQAHRAILGDTAHRVLPEYHTHESTGPIKLQDHGTPVHYRNIWIRELPADSAAANASEKK